jgi:AcrR family transcriptional regulator
MTAPPTRPALRQRYDLRRQRVTAIAARLFAERGYHATTISDLTEATGLAAGGLYHYIGSKQELLFRICNELMEPLLAQARLIVSREASPDEQLRELLRVWLVHIERHRDHMLVFQQERHVIEREPRWRNVRKQRKDFERILDDILARCENEGIVAFRDRRLALLALLGMVNHTAQWLRKQGRLTPEQIADGYCDILLGGYLSYPQTL